MDTFEIKHYDYIFTGAGLSALMTVYEMIQFEKFKDKSILLLDENPKKTNDRTWCFWEQSKGKWDKLLTIQWNSAIFSNQNFNRSMDLSPNQYKMIKGIDFYNKILKSISNQKNITFLHQKVLGYNESADGVVVQTNSENFLAKKLINSIYDPKWAFNQKKYPVLQQHFIGWFIKTDTPVFDPNQVTFMDFSVPQNGNTRFMYVLPTSNTEALFEYTLFSKDLLSEIEYEEAIKAYLKKAGITQYEVIDKERGNIPMTVYPFWKNNTKNVLNIGSAGGWTKASTGYTFKNTTKKSKALVAFLFKETDFRKFHKINKFWFYDLLFLDVLNKNNELGNKVFSALFEKGNPTLIFKFLDEETTLWEDLQVIWKCPKGIFIKALFGRILPWK